MRKFMVAGNWKMNGARAANGALIAGIRAGLHRCPGVEVLLCPPMPYLESVGAALAGSPLVLGAQNASEQEQPGAFTGETHAGMLKDLGCRYVIVGHSERRALYGEDSARVARKFRAVQQQDLVPVLCVGETLEQRESGRTEAVLLEQMRAVLELCGIGALGAAVVAYEPVWAIGTGRTATPEQAREAHAFLRGVMRKEDAKIAGSTRILYGGSVKGDNAGTLFAGADIDGGLIGGASLKAEEFLTICAAAQAQITT